MARENNLFISAAWMVGISIALFFLPVVNGLIGGAVGGYKAGGWKRGLLAALIPAIVVAIGLWLIFALFDAGTLGFLAGIGVGFIILFADLGIFLGAAVGGYMAERKAHA